MPIIPAATKTASISDSCWRSFIARAAQHTCPRAGPVLSRREAKAGLLSTEIFAVVRIGPLVGCAAGRGTEAWVALGESEVRTAEQSHRYGDDRHEPLHCYLLLLREISQRALFHCRIATDDVLAFSS